MLPLNDTIAAVATPPGEGGIAVIRVSGPEAIAITDRCFSGKSALTSAISHTAHLGDFHDGKVLVDQVICTVFRAPHSYSGEDTVEVGCHGGSLVTRRVLEALLHAGARHARPGEFTQRAFLNGRMDLSEAEAVADLIHAHSDLAHRVSIEQLRGRLHQTVEALRTQLVDSASMIELELDFAEEGYEFKDKSRLTRQLLATKSQVGELASTFQFGRVWREGLRTVIAGLPNVGKSSLLNALLNQERAIVTDIPGTTRDFIEESINLDGLQFRLTDTAGLRETRDPAESAGVGRSLRLLDEADLVLFVLDGTKSITEEERTRVMMIQKSGKGSIIALNKMDLPGTVNPTHNALSNFTALSDVIGVSALTGFGLAELKSSMVRAAARITHPEADTSLVVTNSRHYDALMRALGRLQLALDSLSEGQSGEFVALDVRGAMDCLGEIVGVITTDDVLNNIFSRFCIGK